MNSSTDDLPTSILPLSDGERNKLLSGVVVHREDLKAFERGRMFSLLCTYFSGVRHSRFEADLEEKEMVVVLRDKNDGQIQGFSTLVRMEVSVNGQDIVAFFSGDTIVAQEYWGETVLSRLWAQTVFAEADKITLLHPSAKCSGS